MPITIFLMLSGLGVVFLLYVLANFLKEGHRPVSSDRNDVMEFRGRNWEDVLVVTHMNSGCAECGGSVIPFQAREAGSNAKQTHKVA